jgi:hypothetical protein
MTQLCYVNFEFQIVQSVFKDVSIYEKGTLKATEHDKYENIAGSV